MLSSRPRINVDPTASVELIYILRGEDSQDATEGLRVDVRWRPLPSPGMPAGRLQPFQLEYNQATVPTHEDRRLLDALWHFCHPPDAGLPPHAFLIPPSRLQSFLMLLDATDRARWLSRAEDPPRLKRFRLQHALPGDFALQAIPLPNGDVALEGQIRLAACAVPMAQVHLLGDNKTAYLQDMLHPVNLHGAVSLARRMEGKPPLALPFSEAFDLIRQLALTTTMELDALPPALQQRRLAIEPTGELYFKTAKYTYQGHEQLHADLNFAYDGVRCAPDDETPCLPGRLPGTVIPRDPAAEKLLQERLSELGFRYNAKATEEEIGWKLPPARLDSCVRTLVMEGWLIHAEGKTYRRPVPKPLSMSSGQDWFDLKGGVDFDGQLVPLPVLLQALRHGSNAVRLDDGTYGMLPTDWLLHFTALLEIGEIEDDRLRFRREQAALLDAILADRTLEADAAFEKTLQELHDPALRPAAVLPPPNFQATLRPYQQEGLGWLLYMQRLHLGACLADDMGLGKTIQVLALLATSQGRIPKPSLIVMPKSLIFNWLQEAEKFAPSLSVHVYAGSGRSIQSPEFRQADCVLTTYGTLRNDAVTLSSISLGYCILDESQAIKNMDSATAKAARAIHAAHRIAMTGTPVENHLGELFSQLEFLNPGLFGPHFATVQSGGHLDKPALAQLRKGVAPFILRRTKQQVAADLPPKTEEILWCEPEEEEKARYEELRAYYRNLLAESPAPADNTAAKGSNGSLEPLVALLRLRQAACHPALIDASREADDSAKLLLLMDKLTELKEAGHKALVFSQFTQLLKLVASRLERSSIGYCYLDGQTSDRGALVNDFQTSTEKSVFLISLKAGGTGLNLTAANYVFLLDPWWNPAIEAQAIDRAFRIGQTLPVVAYRLITRGTVEEKVRQLQLKKSRLATAVLSDTGDNRLTLEDFRFLLD